MFMVLCREQWKRMCSWVYIGNSGNEMCSWYYIGNVSENCYVHGTTVGTVETVVLMVLHWEQWKRLCSWYYTGNSGNEMCLRYYIGNSGNGYVHGTELGTVEMYVFMELHW